MTADRRAVWRRRDALALAGAWLAAASCGCRPSSAEEHAPLRVGYQKWGTCSILKASGRLEEALAREGRSVEWIEFPAGPPLLEALNAGSIDVGHTGDSPPLFAQAAGVPFVYIAASSPSPESSALLVRASGEIRRIEDLRGKRVALTKGSSAHTLVVRSFEKHSLSLDDFEPVYLAPADGRAALASGAVDGWSIWDPYLSAAEHSGDVRRLVSGEGVVSGREFYLASRKIVESRPALVEAFLRELNGAKEWARERPDEVNRLLAEQTGLSLDVVRLAESRRRRYDTRPLSPELIAEQQALADRYVELRLLPRAIDVADAVHSFAVLDSPFEEGSP